MGACKPSLFGIAVSLKPPCVNRDDLNIERRCRQQQVPDAGGDLPLDFPAWARG